MSEVVIKTRLNGPPAWSRGGQDRLTMRDVCDLTGKENVALCRCGQTKRRPFCDGTHESCGWVAEDLVPPVPTTPAPPPPLRFPAQWERERAVADYDSGKRRVGDRVRFLLCEREDQQVAALVPRSGQRCDDESRPDQRPSVAGHPVSGSSDGHRRHR